MPKFISLTEHDSSQVLDVNEDMIVAIGTERYVSGSYVYLANKKVFHVEETADEIKHKLNGVEDD